MPTEVGTCVLWVSCRDPPDDSAVRAPTHCVHASCCVGGVVVLWTCGPTHCARAWSVSAFLRNHLNLTELLYEASTNDLLRKEFPRLEQVGVRHRYIKRSLSFWWRFPSEKALIPLTLRSKARKKVIAHHNINVLRNKVCSGHAVQWPIGSGRDLLLALQHPRRLVATIEVLPRNGSNHTHRCHMGLCDQGGPQKFLHTNAIPKFKLA